MSTKDDLVGYIVYTDSSGTVNIGSEQAKYREFWCKTCITPYVGEVEAEFIPCYRVNIGIYSQICTCCGKLLVDGVKSFTGKPLSLFDKEKIIH